MEGNRRGETWCISKSVLLKTEGLMTLGKACTTRGREKAANKKGREGGGETQMQR